MDAAPTWESLPPERCWALLRDAPVGRLGLSIDALPWVLPVRFVVLDRAVIFGARAAPRLEAAASGAVVAFEVDHYAEEDPAAWSVLVRGVAEPLAATDQLVRSHRPELRRLDLEGPTDRYLRLPGVLVSGRAARWPPPGTAPEGR